MFIKVHLKNQHNNEYLPTLVSTETIEALFTDEDDDVCLRRKGGGCLVVKETFDEVAALLLLS